jgi:hypothetical protein
MEERPAASFFGKKVEVDAAGIFWYGRKEVRGKAAHGREDARKEGTL